MIKHLFHADVYQLAFAGGEPMLRADFFELSAFARELGLTIQVATNGLFIDSRTARRLCEVGYQCVQISIDGLSAESHELIRGTGTFEATIAAIDHCREAGLPVVLALALHRRNFGELRKILQFAELHHIDIVKVQPVWMPFLYRDGSGQGALSITQICEAVTTLRVLFADKGITLAITDGASALAEHGRMHPICSPTFNAATIFQDGSVSPCFQGESHGVGNIATDGFVSPWSASVQSMRAREHCYCGESVVHQDKYRLPLAKRLR